MKKFISILVIVMMFAGVMASCGNGANNTDVQSSDSQSQTGEESKSPDNTDSGSFKVGIVQIADHPSLDEIRDSFIEELESYNMGIEIEYKSAQGDTSNLNTICQNYVAKEVDVIVAIATPTALSAVSAVTGTDIPVIFSAVSDPVGAGLATDGNVPIDNVTGTSDVIPVEQIIEMALKVNPDAKNVGILFNPGEPNSISATDAAKEYLTSKGISFIESGASSVGDLQTATESLVSKNVDFIFAPNDNTVATGMQLVAEICKDGGVPIYVGADTMVKDGGFATIGVNYTYLGQQTADMCKTVLEGTKASDIPIRFMEEYVVMINKSVADDIGMDISTDIFKGAEIVE